MILSRVLRQAKTQLKEVGIPSYGLDGDLLLAHVLETTREHVIANPNRELSESEVQNFNSLISRRVNREPIAHILGRREFFGRDFIVTKDTLDPRPDSETLIEEIFELFPNKGQELEVIDFGTGTGCLLLTVLAEYPNAKGIGVDINPDTLEVAKRNANKLNLADRASFVVSNWSEEIQGKFDLVISNPPYIQSSDIKDLEKEVSEYEPKGALDGGDDGLDCYKILAPSIASLLSENGSAVIEFGIGQDNAVATIFESAGMKVKSHRKDLAGITRCLSFCK